MSNKSDFESSPFIQDGELPQGIANALLRHNADAILIGDVETRTLVWANRAGEEMLGRDQAEIQGLPLAAIHPPEDLAYVMGQFDSQSRREFLITNDIPVLDAKGKISYHDVQSVPVQIDGHNYLMGCFRNIADRKEAEARALEGERRFEQVIKELPMGLHLYHLMEDGRLVFIGANRAADQILGLNHDDFINKELEEAFPDLKGTKIPDIYRKLAGDGGVWREEQLVYEDDKISGAFEVVAFQVRLAKWVPCSGISLSAASRKQRCGVFRPLLTPWRSLFLLQTVKASSNMLTHILRS
jgi:PAS domain S-box-containing protein